MISVPKDFMSDFPELIIDNIIDTLVDADNKLIVTGIPLLVDDTVPCDEVHVVSHNKKYIFRIVEVEDE